MAYELGSWGQMVDYYPPDQSSQLRLSQSFIWSLTAFMKGTIGPGGSGVWTVTRSSDGSSVADGDLWGNTFDPSKLVRATAGVAHSWIVLKAPATLSPSLYIVFDCSGSSDYSFMAVARFSQIGYPGGTVTNAPTALDDTSCAYAGNLGDTYTYLHRFNGILSARGDFWFYSNALGRSLNANAACLRLQETASNDQWPCIVMVNFASYNSGWYSFFAQTNSWSFKTGAGSQVTWPYAGLILPFLSAGAQLLGSQPISGDVQTHKWLRWPAYFGRSDSAQGCVKGRFPDMWLGPYFAAGAVGAQYPALGEPTHTLINGLWMPFTTCPTF